MTAREAIDQARAAGLTLLRGRAGLRVRGPKPARLAMLPTLAPFAGEILVLLDVEGGPGDPRTCSGCGRSGFTVMVTTTCGDHFCRVCWRETTRDPAVRAPATPTLDRLMAEADARSGRDGGAA